MFLLQVNQNTGYGVWRKVSDDSQRSNQQPAQKPPLLPLPPHYTVNDSYDQCFSAAREQNFGLNSDRNFNRNFDHDQGYGRYERGVGRNVDHQGYYQVRNEGFGYGGREERGFGRELGIGFNRSYDDGYDVREERGFGRDRGGMGFSRGFDDGYRYGGREERGFGNDMAVGYNQGYDDGGYGGGQEGRVFARDPAHVFRGVQQDNGYYDRENYGPHYGQEFHGQGDLLDQFRGLQLGEHTQHPVSAGNMRGGGFNYSGGKSIERNYNQGSLLGSFNGGQNLDVDFRKLNQDRYTAQALRGQKSAVNQKSQLGGYNQGSLLGAFDVQSFNRSLIRSTNDYYGKSFEKSRRPVNNSRGKMTH